MEKSLKIVDKAKQGRNTKGPDAAVQDMVELIKFFLPDQGIGIDKMFSATVLTAMQTSEVPSHLVQSIDLLPAPKLMT